ncbi:MAG: hypothetical protein KatS3mg019_0843 [Fimbriimonadales bacterium]|nr:MAG: hypothetical protein KatS3mg019_0843 [Fimbriimonadales bacterium]
MAFTREDLKELPKLLQSDPELQMELAQLILSESVVADLMRRDPTLREVFRRAVLTEELLKLPHEFREFREETTERLIRVETDVAETKQRVERVEQDVAETKQRVERVEQDVAETKQRVERVEQDVAETKQRVERLEVGLNETRQGVNRLESWQQGESGRRVGEEYERKIARRARRIFGPGDGGSPKYSERVQLQLDRWMVQAGMLDDMDEEIDPLEADLIWWKGNRVAVTEISIKVDKDDVYRAKRRAEALGKTGQETIPVVIGSEWAHPETEQLAHREGVAWRVGNKFSESLIAYRQLDAPE